MLVISRKVNQSFTLGGDPPIAIRTILGIRGRKIRIGIEADRSIPAHRTEVHVKIYGKKPSTGLFRPP